MATDNNDFLEAEEAVNDLLENVQRLKNEIEGYGAAKETLLEVREQLGEITQSIGDIAKTAASVIQTLQSIGTAEILKEIANTASANIDALNSSTALLLAKTEESLSRIGGSLLDELSSAREEISSLDKKLMQRLQNNEKDLAEQGKSLKLLVLIWVPIAMGIALGVYSLLSTTG